MIDRAYMFSLVTFIQLIDKLFTVHSKPLTQALDMTTTTISARTNPSVELRPQSSKSTIENRLKAALEHARRLTQMYGHQNVEAAIAWETVEEMRSAQLRQPAPSYQSAFDRYCVENPHARECRFYEC